MIYEINVHAFDDNFDDEIEVFEEGTVEDENLVSIGITTSQSGEEELRAMSSNEAPPSKDLTTFTVPDTEEHLEVFQEQPFETSSQDGVKELLAEIGFLDLTGTDSDQGCGGESDSSPMPLSRKKKVEILEECDPCGIFSEPENLKLEEEALMPYIDKPFAHACKSSALLKDWVKPKLDGSGHYLEDDP